MTYALPRDEFFEIARSLEKHHNVFYAMWERGHISFDGSIPTAAVKFDPDGRCFDFVFNPDFWESLPRYDREFIICHEMLHVILNHGVRALHSSDKRLSNVAMDIVVNHALVDRFGFDRERLALNDELCWIDTVFGPDNIGIASGEAYEYYLNLLRLTQKQASSGGDGESGSGGEKDSIDDHSGLGRMAMDQSEVDSALGEIGRGMSETDAQSLVDAVGKQYERPNQAEGEPNDLINQVRGDGPGGIFAYAAVARVKKKRKWETVIKKWSKKFDKTDDFDREQWARRARRFATLDPELMLPTELPDEDIIDGRIEVWFFQDTSGSCAGFRDRFFSAALSLPKERFDVKMHCFDTQVYETTLESRKLYGFGGTYFHILEDYVQLYCKKHESEYPKAVFVITDGFGTHVRPQMPERWYVFLSTDYRMCFPKEINIYRLRDFE